MQGVFCVGLSSEKEDFWAIVCARVCARVEGFLLPLIASW